MNNKKLMRSSNKMVAGVCGGIGEYMEVDPTVIRVLYVILSFVTGIIPLLIAYFVLCLIMPQK